MGKNLFIILFIVFLLNSCATVNPYTSFYSDLLDNKSVSDFPNLISSQDEPKIYESNDMKSDIEQLLINNFVLIGYSGFNAGELDQMQALEQARLVGATLVLVSKEYTNTVSGNVPLVLPTSEKSSTNLSGNISGEYFSGTATTTTNSSTTYNIPYSKRKYDYLAGYFVKRKPLSLGINYTDIPIEIRKTVKRNRGIFITMVFNDSPAFYADLFSGDIIIAISGVEINNKEHFSDLLENHKGLETEFQIIRDNEKITKIIKLN